MVQTASPESENVTEGEEPAIEHTGRTKRSRPEKVLRVVPVAVCAGNASTVRQASSAFLRVSICTWSVAPEPLIAVIASERRRVPLSPVS